LNHEKSGNLYDRSFSIVQILGFERKFFLRFFVDILPLGSGSMDPHIFSDPEPGRKNLTDPDPKHWKKV